MAQKFTWATPHHPMTLEDLKVFIASAEAFGANMAEPVKVRITIGGKVKAIEVTAKDPHSGG
jgi:hypothetical protein